MIDLHTHSAQSDGTDSPTGLVEAAAAAGLTTVALTDHDTTSGWDEARAAAERVGIALVRGSELSTRHAGISVHLLAYLFDPEHPGLRAEMQATLDDRLPRLQRIVQRLADDGYELTWEDVAAQMEEGATPGRPHVADALVARGYAPDRSAVFHDLLYSGSPYYVPHYAPATADAVRLVREAGGVPVLAHPFAATRGRTIWPDDVRSLTAAGLLGIEVHHRDHDPDGVTLARDLARELDLVPTGSSDYHGSGKVNRLGERTTDPGSLERIEAAATGTPVVR